MSNSLVIACPQCRQKNRVPLARFAEQPVCGACKGQLFSDKPLSVDEAGFNAQLGGELPVVVDFWAPWCGPCRQFAPVFEQAARQFGTRARLMKVDTEQEQRLGQRFNIRSIPTLAVFHRGREIARVAGALPPQQFARWLEEALAKAV
jgi:thioredoxin 2